MRKPVIPTWALAALTLVTISLHSNESHAVPADGPSTETVGIKNFSQYFKSMERITSVQTNKHPEIISYYLANVTRLPKLGRVEEINGPTLMTYVALAGLFCRAEVGQRKGLNETKSEAAIVALIHQYAQLFVDRDARPAEIRALLSLSIEGSPSKIRKKLALSFCTAFASSMEFIAL